MKNTKTSKFIVITGTFDDCPGDIDTVGGIFNSFDKAHSFVTEEYKALHPMDGDEDMNPDLDFATDTNDGHTFWRILEV